jgi:hypothetical protein
MDLEGEISWVTNFTLGATAQATLVYKKLNFLSWYQCGCWFTQSQDLKVFLEQIKVGPLHSLYVYGSSTLGKPY